MSIIVKRRAEDGLEHLALRFPSGALKGAGAAIAAAMAEEGRIVSGGSSSAWRLEKAIQDEEGALLVGPNFEGLSLDDAAGLEEGFSRLAALARAFSLLLGEGSLPRGLVSSGILFSKQGDILFMPAATVSMALVARGADARAAAVARLASPRSDGPEADASFLLAQAAYRFATGRPAFEREAAEHGRLAGSRRDSIATALASPRLDPGLAALIDEALADPRRASLADWIAALEAAEAEAWTRDLDPGQEAAIARRREAIESDARARKGRADFFRKRGGILIGVAVAVVVASLFFGDIARAQRDKPDYSWLSARELVQRYYLAVEGLDLESLEACVDKNAVKSDWNYVMNLVVLTKTRMAYEGKSPILHALDWVSSGRPALTQTDLLYGIVGLSISEESVGADFARLRAEYSFWSQERPESAPSDSIAVPAEERRVDELSLERGEKGWKIVDLKRSLIQ